MKKVRLMASLLLAIRKEQKIRVRQPLSVAYIKIKERFEPEMLKLLISEINVKDVIIVDDFENDNNIIIRKEGIFEVGLNIEITKDLSHEGKAREIIRLVQDLRKQSGLQPKDKIELVLKAQKELDEIINKFRDYIMKETQTKQIVALKEGVEITQHTVDGHTIEIGIIV